MLLHEGNFSIGKLKRASSSKDLVQVHVLSNDFPLQFFRMSVQSHHQGDCRI